MWMALVLVAGDRKVLLDWGGGEVEVWEKRGSEWRGCEEVGCRELDMEKRRMRMVWKARVFLGFLLLHSMVVTQTRWKTHPQD